MYFINNTSSLPFFLQRESNSVMPYSSVKSNNSLRILVKNERINIFSRPDKIKSVLYVPYWFLLCTKLKLESKFERIKRSIYVKNFLYNQEKLLVF